MRLKTRLRKNDDVVVIKGKDKGKSGKIISINAAKGAAIVQGVRFKRCHRKPNQQTQEGGIIVIESPIPIANLAYHIKVKKGATKGATPSYSKLAFKEVNGKKRRVVKRTMEEI